MNPDLLKLTFTYAITLLIIGFGFYALVLYPYDLDQLVKGAVIGFMGMAINHVYGEQVSARTSKQQQTAFDAGLVATPPTTTTVSAGPPVTVTQTPTEPQG